MRSDSACSPGGSGPGEAGRPQGPAVPASWVHIPALARVAACPRSGYLAFLWSYCGFLIYKRGAGTVQVPVPLGFVATFTGGSSVEGLALWPLELDY